MTTTAPCASAAHAWQSLADGDWSVLQALDYVMEAEDCERSLALEKMHHAAADGLEAASPDGQWPWRTSEACGALRLGVSSKLARLISDMRDWYGSQRVDSPSMRFWQHGRKEWCDEADAILNLLRSLAAIPGGEASP
jgi:hypothetical protein